MFAENMGEGSHAPAQGPGFLDALAGVADRKAHRIASVRTNNRWTWLRDGVLAGLPTRRLI